VVFDEKVEGIVRDVCLEIAKRYEVEFLEIDLDYNHVNFFGAIGARL